MIIINSVSNTLFSFNGIEYFRNYISVVRGERIEIFNCYERDDVMLPLTHYSEVSLNGITYSNATDLQSVLQTVIYSRATLGSDEVEVVEQNNLGKVIYLDYVSGSNLLTQVLGDINSQTTLISATDNPVFFTAYKSASTASVAQKLRFQFMGGKGTWGAGGNAVLPSHLYQLPPESLLPEDITANSKSNVISLGQVTNEPEFLIKANSAVRDLTDTSKLHYFSYSLDSVLYLKRFTGQPGEYDGTQIVLTETDFNEATNSNVQPGLYLPTLKDITAVDSFTDSPITITNNNTGDNITFSGSSIKHTSVNGDTTTLDYQPNTEDVTYSIPAKSTDDVFAMQSDVNGITIVSNQLASELYLKNVDGTTLATINLGFLNNEGTTFFYNETSEKLELKNDDGEVLSEVPVSAFVANLMQSVNFNGSTPQILEFKDAEGNVVDSVSFSISNIQGLQTLLNAKVSYADMDSVPTSGSNNAVKSGGIHDMTRKYVVSTETNLDNYNEAGYFLTPSSGVLNLPNGFSQTRYTLTVNAANLNYGSQILVSCGLDGFIAMRRRSGSEWGKWICFTDSNIGDAEDLNNYINTGVFAQTLNTQATSGTNYPEPYAGMLTVHYNGGIVWQTYLCYSGTNNLYHRGRTSSGTWSNWVKEWDSSDFSQADIDNWNTAFSWGDFRDYGLGKIGISAYPTSDLNDITVANGFYSVPFTVLNVPINNSGTIIIERYAFGNSYITQKYQAVNVTDAVRMFIRHYRPGASSWTPWREIWTSENLTTDSIAQWDEAYNRGDFRDFGLGTDCKISSNWDNITQSGFYRNVNSSTAGIPLAVGSIAMLHMEVNGNAVQMAFRSGGSNYYIRRRTTSTWSSWDSVLTSSNINTSDIDNWNKAFGWGDFRTYGLGGYENLGNVGVDGLDTISNNTGFYIVSGIDTNIVGTNSAKVINIGNPAVSTVKAQIAISHGGSSAISFRNNVTNSWQKIWHDGNLSQSSIDNWNTAFGWGDYRDFGLGNTTTANISDANNPNLPGGLYSTNTSTLNVPLANLSGTLLNMRSGVFGGAVSQMWIRANTLTGEDIYVRHCDNTGTFTEWKRIWHAGDFTQSNIDNWNTAYNRGDYKDYGLGINTTLIYPETDLNSITVPNGFYTVPNTILNIPTNAGGALTVERYSTYITQKYQAVNPGDVVRIFYRHYKTGSASWTPWREIWTDENFKADDKAEVNDTLSFKGIIPSNDDINNYIVNGFYSTESSTTANLPVEDKGILTVASNGNNHSQTYTNYNSNELYFRTTNPSGGGWNSWERVAKSSERVINDTLTSAPSAASLNALYPSVKPTFTVIAPNVGKGNMYVKTNTGWLVFLGSTVF
ncbi:pyocin knob domain-containing protein [Flavobacterium rakeshii]|uniref:pyocin knob domain-containing protein n=1 Tax=Flavobacterium rakeshii TaxID=1038845 RepID=UPI002E7C36AE|nr:pyocin knob domain-containing protein [Flavobacterium rakeshii]MEE1898045.1 pyocin knob domain-containing protein [Flavobacterium rakeshii]